MRRLQPASRFGFSFMVLALLAPLSLADEGMWPPDQLGQLDWAALKRRGIQLTAQQIWGPDGAGLAQAVVSLEGCTGGLVSPEGLVLTNHHCAYGAIQQHSTPDRNLLRDGFVAATRADELPAKGVRVLVLRRIEDVTSKFRPTVAFGKDDEARQRAIERLQKALIADCERKPGARCKVAAHFGGLRYVLQESLEVRDVRLVYAPPAAIGDFGGEIDNWRWPRHTGDFTLLRAYVAPDGGAAEYARDNVPFRPARHLALAPEGVQPGASVMLLGYPGKTDRYGTSNAVRRDISWWYPARRAVYGGIKGVLEEAAEAGEAAALAAADGIKSAANRLTNAQAMIAGLERNGVLAQRETRERRLRQWIEADPQRREKYGSVLADLDAVLASNEATLDRDHLLAVAPTMSKPLGAALTLVRWSRERAKPDLEREPGYQERDRTRVRASLERMQKDLHPAVDRAALAWYLGEVLALPEGQRVGPIDAAVAAAAAAGASREEALEAYVEHALGASAMTTAEGRLALFDVDAARIEASTDPLVVLARELQPLRDAIERAEKARLGAYARLRPLWFEALLASRGRGDVYPDADGTLRVALAKVRGYSPRDGLTAVPQTTVAGLLAKDRGEPPFEVPERVRAAAAREGGAGPESVPVAFLADADTTGGNSGAPVVDGRGRLVGVNFDRVWENVAGDYGWTDRYSRNICVDVRFILWMLGPVDGAEHLLRELGVDS